MSTVATRAPAIRPIAPDDADALLRFHHGLSAETARRRFLVFHPELSEREVRWFTTVDHDRREALVATDGDDIVGVARYDRLADGTAELAIVVTDAWQRQGVGTGLLTALVERGRAAGVATFVAETLPENVAIHRLLDRVGVR
jgi:RimJ/RimL family protein N-acetyltransferase